MGGYGLVMGGLWVGYGLVMFWVGYGLVNLWVVMGGLWVGYAGLALKG